MRCGGGCRLLHQGACARRRLSAPARGPGLFENWFIAAQFAAYLDDGLWLKLAQNANAMAERLAQAIDSADARLALRPDGNEVFVILTDEADNRLKAAGAVYHPWSVESLPVRKRPTSGECLVRLVTSWQSTEADVDLFASNLRRK